MCRRFSLPVENWTEVLELYGVINRDFRHPPRYNIATNQLVPAVISDGQCNRIGLLKWGLIPSWASDAKIGAKMVNARAETLLEKPSFKHLVTRKRCLVLADGFFEWRHVGKEKQPFRIRVKERDVFGMAGLYDTWTAPNGEKISTCTVITTEPNELMKDIHDRMPVILNEKDERVWLDRIVQDPVRLISMLKPYVARDMYAYPVSSVVGNVRNDSPECIAR